MGDPNFKPCQITAQTLRDKILAGFSKGTVVHIDDRNGDSYLFDVHVISDDFKGLSRIQQHQKVYALLQQDFKDKLHAVTLKTETQEALK
jgi:stress-induced morphogen